MFWLLSLLSPTIHIFFTSPLHFLHFDAKKKMQCPSNSFRYNATQCECNPGYLFNFTSRICYLFDEWGPVESDSGVDYRSLSFPGSGALFDFDSIRRLTQSQAVFLEATLIMLLSWLCFCFFARCAPLGDGRSIWFKIRWWISRLDICFASRHWLVWFLSLSLLLLFLGWNFMVNFTYYFMISRFVRHNLYWKLIGVFNIASWT